MTLDTKERRLTSRELKANLDVSGLTPEAIRTDLGFTQERLASTLELDGVSRREDVWTVREYLDDRIHAQGGRPRPYTLL